MMIKSDVDIRGVAPEAVLGMIIANDVYKQFDSPFVLTAVRDGKHMEGSLHYRGLAFDCRLPREKAADVVKMLKFALGPQWDVVLEATHVHVEYDVR